MQLRLPSRLAVEFPPWLKSNHPGLRAFVALFTIIFVIIQAFGNLPNSALRMSLQPARNTFDELGLYERGWGMFAATNTSTSVVRSELTFADGSQKEIQYVALAPGYGLSVWNEVMQDLQFDDNNDKLGRYLSGFLDYTCKQYNTNVDNPLITVAFQQQVTRIPSIKANAAKQNQFTTRQIRTCTST
jgi:hypothetical protein